VIVDAWPAWAAVVGSVLAALLAAGLIATRAPGRLVRANYAGRPVPAVLGPPLVLAGALGGVVVGWAGSRAFDAPGWAALAAMIAVGGAGLIDDLSGSGPRGLRGHLGSLLSGRPTTGILKLALGVAAGVLLAVLLGGGPVRVAAAAVLMGASVNVWNALDVVPGRAIKWALLPLGVALLAGWNGPAGLLAGSALGAAVGVLPFDLHERGMLGDTGSNPLGLVVGYGLAATLPTAGVVIGAVAVLALQAAAETVTISRLVEATSPLRWLDRVGRRP
jgi:UDP-GlcNAc:undecaprenyl-phosphate GlcNAc-1-phosphate transferase